MKLIFLDIDGVLNCKYSKSRIPNSNIIGIDDDKVELLKKIIDSCDEECRIILTSSWKHSWYKKDKSNQNKDANYLDEKLNKYNLKIYDKTIDESWNRGRGIRDYLDNCKEDISNFIVLDDNIFKDYEEEKIMDYLILTDILHGLIDYFVDKAIEKLNKK